jgi:hypothetical protein
MGPLMGDDGNHWKLEQLLEVVLALVGRVGVGVKEVQCGSGPGRFVLQTSTCPCLCLGVSIRLSPLSQAPSSRDPELCNPLPAFPMLPSGLQMPSHLKRETRRRREGGRIR